MAGNVVRLEFAGDATKLAKASKDAEKSLAGVGQQANDTSEDMARGSKEATDYASRLGSIGNATSGLTDAMDVAAGGVQALVDIQQAGIEKAARLARANHDVAQAQEDYNQALRDGKQAALDVEQAAIDVTQARIDEKTALKDYNAAVKEFGANSLEAQQAQNDMKQAGLDLKQAQEDHNQALRDGAQASLDAQGATLDLADAQREANPPDLQQWADQLNLITPLLSAVVGIIGLVTAAQWAWNAALAVSPIVWIIGGIALVVAGLVLLEKKTGIFSKAWNVSWKWIKETAQSVADWFGRLPGRLSGIWRTISNSIKNAFRSAFNWVADAWNNTVGSFSWSVPGWIPGIGGQSISAPRIPRFHTGGIVPGPIGQETLAILQGGEKVVSTGDGGGANALILGSDGTAMGDALVDIVSKAVRRAGGDVQVVLGGRNARRA